MLSINDSFVAIFLMMRRDLFVPEIGSGDFCVFVGIVCSREERD